MDVVKVNQVEGELDSFVARADKLRREKEGERPAEEAYLPNVRKLAEKRHRRLAWEWLRFHERQLESNTRTAALIARHHEQEIRRYEEVLGIDNEREEN